MSNEHIARLQKIGIGLESTAGTAVAVSFWMPKAKGLLVPKIEYKYDQAAYGDIEKNREAYITKKWAELTISATEPRDSWIGYLLKLLYGNEYPCVLHTTSSITGTFQESEVVTESTSSATGTLRKLDTGGTTKYLYIEPISGTFVGGGKTLTGGTSGATCTNGTIESQAAVRYHVYRKLNSNNHPSATVYGQDPVSGDERATYCVMDTFDLEAIVNDFLKFSTKLIGQPMASTTPQTPTYAMENPFLGKHLAVYFASAFTGLDAAAETALERMKLGFTKGAEVIQQSGSASDPLAPTSIHNGDLELKGDFTALFNTTTLRDAALAGTAQALRMKVVNSAVQIGSAANPTLQFDIPEVYLNDWGKSDDNAKIVRQNIGFIAVRNNTRGFSSEAVLCNTKVTAY